MRRSIWAVLLGILLVGCQTAASSPQGQSSVSPSVASFTYSVFPGGLWQVDLNGRKVSLLPDDGVEKWHLGWSPDRKTLAYVARYYEPGGAEESLFVLASGGQPKKLIGPATQILYRWSDTPRQIDVWSSQARLNTPPPTNADGTTGRWYRVDTETGAAVETRPPDNTPSSPLPSPDGKWSLAMEPDNDQMAVYLVDSSGIKVAKLFAQRPVLGLVPPGLWSPDSRLIAFVLDRGASSDLYVFSLETKVTAQLSHYADKGQYALMSDLEWSPNSQWLSFAFSDTQSANQLCLVRNVDYTLRCFNVGWKANEFVWSTDSRYVAFLAPITDARLQDLYALEAATGQVLNVTGDGETQNEDWFTAP